MAEHVTNMGKRICMSVTAWSKLLGILITLLATTIVAAETPPGAIALVPTQPLDAVGALAVSRSGALVAAAPLSGAINLIDASSQRKLRSMVIPPEHDASAQVFSMNFAGRDTRLFAATEEFQYVFDVATGRELARITTFDDEGRWLAGAAAISPNGNNLLFARITEQKQLSLHSMRVDQGDVSIPVPIPADCELSPGPEFDGSGAISGLMVWDDGLVAAEAYRKSVCVWKPGRQTASYKFAAPAMVMLPDIGYQLQPGETVTDVVDLRNGRRLTQLPVKLTRGTTVRLSPDKKRWLVATPPAGEITIFDATKAFPPLKIGFSRFPNAIEFLSSDRILAASPWVEVLDISRAASVSASTFGQGIARGFGPALLGANPEVLISSDKSTYVWDGSTGASTRTLEGTSSDTSISSDGKTILTAQASAVAQWPTSFRKPPTMLRPYRHGPGVARAVIAPNGKFIVLAMNDGTLRRHRLDESPEADEIIYRATTIPHSIAIAPDSAAVLIQSDLAGVPPTIVNINKRSRTEEFDPWSIQYKDRVAAGDLGSKYALFVVNSGIVEMREIANPRLLGVQRKVAESNEPVAARLLSEDGSIVAFGGGVLRVFQAQETTAVAEAELCSGDQLQGRASIAVSKRYFVVATGAGCGVVVDRRTLAKKFEFARPDLGETTALSISTDEALLHVGHSKGRIATWGLQTGSMGSSVGTGRDVPVLSVLGREPGAFVAVDQIGVFTAAPTPRAHLDGPQWALGGYRFERFGMLVEGAKFSPSGASILVETCRRRALVYRTGATTSDGDHPIADIGYESKWTCAPGSLVDSRLVLDVISSGRGPELLAYEFMDSERNSDVRPLAGGRPVCSSESPFYPDDSPHKAILFADGKRAACIGNRAGAGRGSHVRVVDVETSELLHTLDNTGPARITGQSMSQDGRFLITGADTGAIDVYELESGEAVRTAQVDGGSVIELSLSRDGKTALVTTYDGITHVVDLESQRDMAKIVFVDVAGRRRWAVIAPDGRYDSDSPGELPGLSWVDPRDPLAAVPVEAFMRDFFEPGLLGKLLRRESLAEITPLEKVDRQLPLVRILSIEPEQTNSSVTVTVEVSLPQPRPSSRATNIKDVRLFRDGQLVSYVEGTVFPCRSENRAAVKCDGNTARLQLKGIPLSAGSVGRAVEFSAFAYNQDDVKGPTARAAFTVPSRFKLPPPRAYVIAIGLNQYQSPDWNLRYAAADAKLMKEAITDRVRRSGAFGDNDVVAIALISDGSETVTKQQIKTVFDILAGRKVAAEAAVGISSVDLLRKATASDSVFITYSGHGTVDEDDEYYLFPYDIGDLAALSAEDKKPKLIAGAEIAEWVRDIDAGEMTIIVDACDSGAIFQDAIFRPGPLNAKGLGQLAYDKGMRILTASQVNQFARESEKLGHGLLTYALAKEGLQGGAADWQPRDGKIDQAEWLQYGVLRTPELLEEISRSSSAVAESSGPRQMPTLFNFRNGGIDIPLN